SPDRRVQLSAAWRIGGTRTDPAIVAGIVSTASIEIIKAVSASPDDHLTTTPYCRMRVSPRRRVSYAGGDPTVCAWIVSPTRVKLVVIFDSTPDDNFTAGRDCGVRISTIRCVSRPCDCPAGRSRIISSAVVKRGRGAAAIFATPNNHYAPGPHCRMRVARRGRICGAGGYPAVCVGIVSPTSVQTVV